MNVSICITYVDQSRYVGPADKHNAESGPSEVFTVESQTAITVSISSLNPPTSKGDQIGTSEAFSSPLTATGWNVYAGIAGQVLTLQNNAPIPIATKFYLVQVPPVASGIAVGPGQYADRSLFFQRTAMRA